MIMKKIISLIAIATFFISCSKQNNANFNIHGKITGLKKGTIFLEKLDLNGSQVLDSVYIDDAQEVFSFSENIKEADMFAISLDKSLTRRILFFGEPGTIDIETDLNKFISKAKITGSKQQDLLMEHDSYTKEIQFQNLDLIKEKFEAQKNGELDKVDDINNKYNHNLKRIYLFSANYAINNSSNVIAAYIAVTRMDNAAPKLKKQIYDALTPEVKESKYGLLLKEELDARL
ncbi:hypothetical protein AXE80_01220 [Wenyingzhuangia fucanilytica]|uniref:DUF4369 domain-containing protein n=2 Tax=Wenyingzhuangia fucanilytica TaxID=1790137 RepID=A0A1B1Y2J5_9FLAO|nr:hypothetical protein AXE80_01220 [Wenyingzhuangia fucanilytica]